MHGKGSCHRCGQWSFGKRKCARCGAKFCSSCLPSGPPMSSCPACDPANYPSHPPLYAHPATPQYPQPGIAPPGVVQPAYVAHPNGGVQHPVQQHTYLPRGQPPTYSAGPIQPQAPPQGLQCFQAVEQRGFNPGDSVPTPTAPSLPPSGPQAPTSVQGGEPGAQQTHGAASPNHPMVAPYPPSQPPNGYVMYTATIQEQPPTTGQSLAPGQHQAPHQSTQVSSTGTPPPETVGSSVRTFSAPQPHPQLTAGAVTYPPAHAYPPPSSVAQLSGAQGFGAPPVGYPHINNPSSPTIVPSVSHNINERQPLISGEAQVLVNPAPVQHNPVQPMGMAEPRLFKTRGKGTCFACGQVKYGKVECLVCETKYCVDCVPQAFGSKAEGPKCMDGCVGQPMNVKNHFRLKACALPPEKVSVNGKELTRVQLEVLLIQNFMFELVADEGTDSCKLWYDRKSGFMGHCGKDSKRMIKSYLDLGHPEMDPNCSGGDIPIFLNGRQLNSKELGRLKKIGVKLTPGRWWLDESGNFGPEGVQEKSGNLWGQLGKRAGLMILFALVMGAAVDGLLGAEGLLEGGAGAGEAATGGGGGMTYMDGGGAIADFGDGSVGVSFTDASGTHHSFYS